ncbi:hypothetical protein AA93_12405 (plasmid) [Xylella fastidiosa subsp. pauca 11399]|nr:hypothetical protein AA93_12405 [Xylella fastidiosa subsp. pauca 11399]
MGGRIQRHELGYRYLHLCRHFDDGFAAIDVDPNRLQASRAAHYGIKAEDLMFYLRRPCIFDVWLIIIAMIANVRAIDFFSWQFDKCF